MPRRLCPQLVAWGTAWLQDEVRFDDVLDALASRALHAGGEGFEPTPLHPVGVALVDWRAAGATTLQLALPVPGDVRGLTGDAAFRAAALESGQAAIGPDWALTATLSPETPSSAARTWTWRRSRVTELRPDPITVAEAEHDLVEAIRETASAFAARGTPSWLTDVGGSLSSARRAGEKINLPASHPPRGVRLVAQSERMAAVLRVVDADPTGELTAAGQAERAALIEPLRLAVRRAMLAGYNAASEPATA